MSWKKAFGLGVCAFKEKRYEDAIKFFTQSIDADSTQPHVFDSRAAAYEQLKRYREALSDTRKCIGLQPERYQSYFRTARIFLSMGKNDRCLQMVEAARKRLNPADAGYPKRIEELVKIEQSAREAEARRRAHVDPLRKLPLELLFDICRSVVQEMDVEHPRGASHFAITLGSVCQSLRELVHSTPWFWQSLTISERYFGRKSSFWLDRLDGQPLYSLSLVGLGLGDSKLRPFLEATGPGSWKHFSIAGSSLHVREIYDLVQHLHLRLHSLNIKTPPEGSMQSIQPYDPFEALSLFSPPSDPQCTRKLSLHVGTLSMSCATLPHITHLDLSFNKLISSQLEPLFYFLRTVPNLRSLIIRPANVFVNNQHPDLPPLPDFKDLPVLRLENLEELRISTIGPLQSLTTLQFPKLQILDLQQLPVAKPAILLRYLTECYPSDKAPLRELRLSRVAMHSPLLLSLLTMFQETLETLEVSYCSALPLEALSTLSFPRLKDVNFSGTDELRGSELVKLVKNGQGMIRNVIVDTCPNVDAAALPWLRANVTGTIVGEYRTRYKVGTNCPRLLGSDVDRFQRNQAPPINQVVRQPRRSTSDASEFWETPVHPFNNQNFAFIHAPGFSDHVTLQNISVKLGQYLASNQPQGQPPSLTGIIYVYPEETPNDSKFGPILQTLKTFIGPEYVERVTLYHRPGKESHHGVDTKIILNSSPVVRSFYNNTPDPKITTSSLNRQTIDRILGSYVKLGPCRTYVQNKTSLGEWVDDNILGRLRQHVPDVIDIEGLQSTSSQLSPGLKEHTWTEYMNNNPDAEKGEAKSGGPSNGTQKVPSLPSIQNYLTHEAAYKEEILNLTRRLEQTQAEYASLRSHMYPQDTTEEPEIVRALNNINYHRTLCS